MSRKRVRWLLAVLLILGIALVSFWWFYLRPPYGITQRSFAKIQNGMTLDEVKMIIGAPPSRAFVNIVSGPDGPIHIGGSCWNGPEATIIVYADDTGIVIGKENHGEKSTGFLSRLLEMFGL